MPACSGPAFSTQDQPLEGSQGPRLAQRRAGTWTLSQGVRSQGTSAAGPSQLRVPSLWSSGAGSERARPADSRACPSAPATATATPNCPSGRRRRRLPQRRKHFLVPGAATPGRPRPAPQLPAGSSAGKGRSPRTPRLRTFSAGWTEPNAAAAGRGAGLGSGCPAGAGVPPSLAPAGEDRGPAGQSQGPGPGPAAAWQPPGLSASSARGGRQFADLHNRSERTHHHGGDRLARDVGHLDPQPETRRSSGKPAARAPAAAPCRVNKGTPARPAPQESLTSPASQRPEVPVRA
ncbi:translation initiation factor IF-2-like [Vulpes lagopus]|uniref:translation initiation factor IF-2-like n=1 Tax=Vulpes lagopus TaxID=494514 RepID=UPI001BC8F80D|nr:translation initiation factor IF-2-like [Vulpes lagopus]